MTGLDGLTVRVTDKAKGISNDVSLMELMILLGDELKLREKEKKQPKKEGTK